MAVPPSAPVPCSPFYLRRQEPCPQCSWSMEEKAVASASCWEPPGPPRAAVPCFAIAVDQDDILPGALRLIRELRPHWKPEQVRTKVAERARGRGWGAAWVAEGLRGRPTVHPSKCGFQDCASVAQERFWTVVCSVLALHFSLIPMQSWAHAFLDPPHSSAPEVPKHATGGPPAHCQLAARAAPPPVAACLSPSCSEVLPSHSETGGGTNF